MNHSRSLLTLASLALLALGAPRGSAAQAAPATPRELLPTLVLQPAEREALLVGLGDLLSRLEDGSRETAATGRGADTLGAVCIEFWASRAPERSIPDTAMLHALAVTTPRRVLPRPDCNLAPRPVVRLADASGNAAIAAEAMLAPPPTPHELLVSNWRFDLPESASFDAIAWYDKRGRRWHCDVVRAQTRRDTRLVGQCESRGLLVL